MDLKASDEMVPLRSAWETVAASLKPLREGDLDTCVAFFAQHVVVKLNGAPPGQPDSFKGREEVRAWLQGLLEQHFEIQEELIEAVGDTLRVRALTWIDATRQLGVAPLEATEVYVLKDGLIASLTWTITPESAAKLHAALART